jgi:phosphatidylserine decarboxylase
MIRLTRHGVREILVSTLLLGVIALVLYFLWRPLALIPIPIFIWLLAFFRDPDRAIPGDPNAMVSPADGTISDITPIENDAILGGPAVRIGIFLSVFNVHINRAPCDGKVISVEYKKGKFVNAMRHGEASQDNESNTLVLADASGKPVAVVKQIVGLIARRIVCTAALGDTLTRGQHIGMIKFGSRTELTIPQRLNPTVRVQIGQKVRGAADVLATISPAGNLAQTTNLSAAQSRP